MKSIAKLGLAAVLVLGGTAAFAQVAPSPTYGSLVTTIETGTMVDLGTFSDASTVTCVKVSTLGEAEANAPTLEAAMTKSEAKLTELRGAITANTAFFDKVKATCAMPDLDVAKIVAVESTAEGQFTVYVDDRA